MRLLCAIALLSAGTLFAAEGAKTGKVQLQSAGPMAFGPNGVLFVGDSAQAAVLAIETGDTASKAAAPFEIKGVNQKVAEVLGTAPDQILINDMIVNPASKNVYLSVSKGKGPDAEAHILRADASGKVSKFALDNVKHSMVSLPDAPDESAKDRRGQSLRVETITDLHYVDGRLFVAGLSNEEFSSSLRAIPYPFASTVKTAGIEIFHGAHGRFETNAPVRTFVPYKVDGEDFILAAYTCTPLVKIPVKSLQPGAKVKGKTIAELGNRNRPLDMIVYSKGGKDYILMANSSRGVMKLPAANLDQYEAITAQTEKQGVPYETIESLKGIQQLDKLDDAHAVVLADADGSMDLRAIPLP
jgi:hypothetical protein